MNRLKRATKKIRNQTVTVFTNDNWDRQGNDQRGWEQSGPAQKEEKNYKT